jgi:flavin reductase (DIM6/NTAB) family NADH-FMN oxidoreductase RutF
MFYRPKDGHGLPHNPFNALITPRPIGWISSRSADGADNLAPYSFFNGVAYSPPQVMFSASGPKQGSDEVKDNVANIRETGVFCVNVCSYDHREMMNASAEHLPHGVDEFQNAGIPKAECTEIACSRVADAPGAMECRLTRIVPLEGPEAYVIMGEVVGIHLRDDCLVDGKFESRRYVPLARMGYREYTAVREVFEMTRPDE